MKEEKENSLKQLKKIKRICKYILVIEAFALLVTSSYAWYRYPTGRAVQSASADVEKLITLSLLDDTATKSLQLFVGNLYPGQKEQIVLCVSNDPMDGTKRQVEEIEYNLKLAYTNNLPVDYKLYPLDKVTKPSGTSINISHPEGDTYFEKQAVPNDENLLVKMPAESTETSTLEENSNALINDPEFEITNKSFKLAMPEGNYEYQYYLLEIDMPKDLPDGILLSNIKKEVDMVYIIATIKQL